MRRTSRSQKLLRDPSRLLRSSRQHYTAKVSHSTARNLIQLTGSALRRQLGPHLMRCVSRHPSIRTQPDLTISSGYTPLPPSTIHPNNVSVSFIPSSSSSDTTPLRLLTHGEPEPNIDELRASVILAEEDLEVEIDLGDGEAEARVWTCDFSHVSVSQASGAC